MKTCKTCAHYCPYSVRCNRKEVSVGIHPVYGFELIKGSTDAYDERLAGPIFARLTNQCGKEGRFHTPQD